MKISADLIKQIIKILIVLLSGTSIGVWIEKQLTPEVIDSIFSAIAAISGGVVTLIIIITNIIKSIKENKEQ